MSAGRPALAASEAGKQVPPAPPQPLTCTAPPPGLPSQQPGDPSVCYVVPTPTSPTASTSTTSAAGSAVPPGARTFGSLAEAVAACPTGGLVRVAAGRYRERLVLDRPVTIQAWPKGAQVEVVWETPQPYQSTVEITAPFPPTGEGGPKDVVVVQGLTVRHSSKSVANNYAVFVRSGAPRLIDLDISSASGAGVGVEGASPQLTGCRVHDCVRQGIAIFGNTAELALQYDLDPALMYGSTGGVVQGCDVYGNGSDGVLVRDGAAPDLLYNLIHNNGGAGFNLQDCGGRYERNTVYDNAKGALAVSALFELEPGDLAKGNSLRGGVGRV